MEDNKPTVAAPTTQTANSDQNSELKTLILDLQNQVKAIQTPPVTKTATASRVEITREGLNELLDQKFGSDNTYATHKARKTFLIENWDELKKSYPLVQNANTDSTSGVLTVSMLASGVVTDGLTRLASLGAYTRNFTSGRIGRNSIQVPHVTAGGTAGSNPTSFEDSTNWVGTMNACTITPAHLVSGASLTNAELQSGWRMAWWVDKKMNELAVKIQAAVNAIIVVGTYTNTPINTAAASFGAAELRSLWGTIKNTTRKSIILDGEYYAQFLPSNLESFNPLTGNTYPGWDGFFMNNYWTGATSNTVGFACGPDALLIGAGLPETAPDEARFVSRQPVTLPEVGLTIDVCNWMNTSARTSWATFEVMFGAVAGEAAQGVMIKSA